MLKMSSRFAAVRTVPWLIAFTVACRADAIASVAADSRSQTVSVGVGEELKVTLGNVGPAQFASPPQISSGAIIFLGVDVVAPFTPAGPTQQFRFRAANRGQAIVQFRRLLGDAVVSVVEDTVEVH